MTRRATARAIRLGPRAPVSTQGRGPGRAGSRSPRDSARPGAAPGPARSLASPGGRCAGPGRRAPRPGAGGRDGTTPRSPSGRRRTPPGSPARRGPRARCRRAAKPPRASGCSARSARRRSTSWRRAAGESGGGAFVSPAGLAPRPQPPLRPVTRTTATATAVSSQRRDRSRPRISRAWADFTRTVSHRSTRAVSGSTNGRPAADCPVEGSPHPTDARAARRRPRQPGTRRGWPPGAAPR